VTKGAPYICPKGAYCVAGVMAKCPAGTFGLQTGAHSEVLGCGQCPAGYFCIEGTSDYKKNPCPRGFYCPNSGTNTSPIECPKGTYNDELNGMSLADCKTCPMGHMCEPASID
jgi:hypothetical protein